MYVGPIVYLEIIVRYDNDTWKREGFRVNEFINVPIADPVPGIMIHYIGMNPSSLSHRESDYPS